MSRGAYKKKFHDPGIVRDIEVIYMVASSEEEDTICFRDEEMSDAATLSLEGAAKLARIIKRMLAWAETPEGKKKIKRAREAEQAGG